MYSVQGYKCVCYGIIMYSFQKNKVCELTSSVFCSSLCLFRWNNYTITTLLHWAAEKGSHCIFMPDLIMRCYVTILAEIYGNPIFSDLVWVLSLGRNPIQVLLIPCDPVRVLSIRSGFCQSNPILSNPIRSWFCKHPMLSIIDIIDWLPRECKHYTDRKSVV